MSVADSAVPGIGGSARRGACSPHRLVGSWTAWSDHASSGHADRCRSRRLRGSRGPRCLPGDARGRCSYGRCAWVCSTGGLGRPRLRVGQSGVSRAICGHRAGSAQARRPRPPRPCRTASSGLLPGVSRGASCFWTALNAASRGRAERAVVTSTAAGPVRAVGRRSPCRLRPGFDEAARSVHSAALGSGCAVDEGCRPGQEYAWWIPSLRVTVLRRRGR